jgi:hypothetical protein
MALKFKHVGHLSVGQTSLRLNQSHSLLQIHQPEKQRDSDETGPGASENGKNINKFSSSLHPSAVILKKSTEASQTSIKYPRLNSLAGFPQIFHFKVREKLMGIPRFNDTAVT